MTDFETKYRDLVAGLEALAESMEWKRPDKSPCESPEACCGSDESCDAMQPSVRVVGAKTIRALLASSPAERPETEHRISSIWQERSREVSWRCSCGFVSKHMRFPDGEFGVVVPVCPDATPASPAEREGEGGECLGVQVVGQMWAQLCDDDGWVRSGMWHFGTDYKCTGSVHPPLDSPIWPGHEIRCANPIHEVKLPLATTFGSVTIATAAPVPVSSGEAGTGEPRVERFGGRVVYDLPAPVVTPNTADKP